MGAEVEWEGVIGEEQSGVRLDLALAGPLGSRARAARLIAEGLVSVDGRPRRKRHAVSAGERVVVTREPLAQPPAGQPAADAGPTQFAIVYEDEHLLIVDKPAGMVVHPARGRQTGTLAQALADRAAGGGEANRLGIVHRLDRDTSGLLVVAKSERSHRELKALLQARELHREYLALVKGTPSARTGTIDAPIGRDRGVRTLHSVNTDSPRVARTHFEVVESLGTATLLRVVLDTGRTHQIRVHMSAIGHPLIGDHSYGGPMRFELERQFLHAARLAFVHPVSGADLDVSSPLPEDLTRALALARPKAA